MKRSNIEFYITPQGEVMYAMNGGEHKKYIEGDIDLSKYIIELMERQYPEALESLSKKYASSKLNKVHYDYLRVSRFVRCNFGKFDGLTYDVQDDVLHVEDVACPIRCECPWHGVICKPKPFGLTARETEVASMISSGMTYDDVSIRLHISRNTIKNTIQKIKNKLHLKSSKDIAKLFVTIATV